MASAIVCDKCGVNGTDESKFMHVRSHKLTSATTYRTTAENYMDVCKKCYNKIFNKKEEDNK